MKSKPTTKFYYNPPMKQVSFLLFTLLFLISSIKSPKAFAFPSHRLARPPYLQNISSDGSVFLHFKTKNPCHVEVRYGKDASSINQKALDKIIRTNHEVKLTALEANQKYFYQIIEKDSRNIASAAHRDFFTFIAPAPSEMKEIKVWILGDPGTASSSEFQKRFKNVQIKVRDAIQTYSKSLPNLIFTLGDNVYPYGSEEFFDKGFFNIYQDILSQVPIYTCYGNHDQGIEETNTIYALSCPRPQGVYFDLFNLPSKGECGGKASGTEAYYSLDYGPAHFIVLDSVALDCNYKQMFAWLEKDLRGIPEGRWKIVISHYPIRSLFFDKPKKSSKITEVSDYVFKTKMLELNDKFDIDLMLSGHVHSYHRTFPVRDSKILSHFSAKTSEANTARYDRHEGTIYIIAGTGGSSWSNNKLKQSAFTAKAFSKPGALSLRIKPDALSMSFISDSGKILDHIKIMNNERRI